MSDNLFRYTYRIPSARAVWHAYNGGLYFVTICTKEHQHYFGEIDTNGMHMSAIGRYAEEQLRNAVNHYPYAEIPLWVVMPNHIHAIVIIHGDCRDVACNVSCDAEINEPLDVARNVSTWNGKNDYMSGKSPKSGSLAVIIRGIKSAITKYARVNNIPFAWQTRFHDHFVRDTTEMNGIADYIENNVARWQTDRFYT